MTFTDSLQQHLDVFRALAPLESAIMRGQAMIHTACHQGQTVFVCGNGGSAADAQHFAAELTGRYISDRPAYAGIALTVDSSALTAIANDYGYDRVFSRQLEGLAKPQDVLLAISTSGNSENVLAAVDTARQKGLHTIALTGGDGGQLAKCCDNAIVVPSRCTARIQEAHIFILHTFCEALEP